MFFFFFSSRRRHTRWPRDWSSDVCSSDLAQSLELRTGIGPGNVDILRPDRLRVVVGEQGCVLVASLADPFDPFGELGMEPPASCFREASVRDLAGERMLEDVLDLTFERGAGAPADEVAALEHTQVGFGACDELGHRTRPEDASDHRSRLQR